MRVTLSHDIWSERFMCPGVWERGGIVWLRLLPVRHRSGRTHTYTRSTLVAMETRRWQHPPVSSEPILIPLRGAECVQLYGSPWMNRCKMAMARLVAYIVLYSSLGELSAPFPISCFEGGLNEVYVPLVESELGGSSLPANQYISLMWTGWGMSAKLRWFVLCY